MPTKDYTDIIVAKSGQDEQEFTIQGVFAQFTYNYTGAEGGYVVDKTGSMYVYGPEFMSEVDIGYTIRATRTIAHFVSEQEAPQAEQIGYKGLLQLKLTSLEIIYDSISAIPMDGIKDMRIKEISETDFRYNDLTTTIVRTNATIVENVQTGFTNYYFFDLSMDQSIYCYSKMSGSDFAWLKQFDGQSKECLIAVHSMRSSDEAWRIIPIQILGDVNLSDDDNAEFALDRLEDQFLPVYQGTANVELVLHDEKLLDESIVSYTSNNEAHKINVDSDHATLMIDGDVLGQFVVTINLNYKSKDYSRDVTITVEEAPNIESLTIAEVMAMQDGQEATVEGIYVRFAANVQGIYLVDETGILTVEYVSLNIGDYKVGEKMIFKGTIQKSFAIEEVYEGHNVLINAELLYHDNMTHEWDKSIVAGEQTISNLNSNPSIDMIGKIYKVRGEILNYNAGYYSNMRIVDPEDGSFMSLYCSNASQLSWLMEYNETVQDFYLYIRDSKTGSSLRIEILEIIKA